MNVIYPLTLTFKFLTVSSFIRVVDATGHLVAYVKQRAFRLREDVTIYSDEEQRHALYHIKADRMIDIGAVYSIRGADGRSMGAVKQRGLRTLWRATYDILDETGAAVGLVHEQDPLVKVLDGLVGGIPFVGFVLAQWINPSYLIESDGANVLRLRKRPSLIERSFLLEQIAPVPRRLEAPVLPAVLMVVLLERGRG